jgi:hypothetical protein
MIFTKDFEEITELTGEELYQYILAFSTTLKEEANILRDWAWEERKKYQGFFKGFKKIVIDENTIPKFKIIGVGNDYDVKYILEKQIVWEDEHYKYRDTACKLDKQLGKVNEHILVHGIENTCCTVYKTYLLGEALKLNDYKFTDKKIINTVLQKILDNNNQ